MKIKFIPLYSLYIWFLIFIQGCGLFDKQEPDVYCTINENFVKYFGTYDEGSYWVMQSTVNNVTSIDTLRVGSLRFEDKGYYFKEKNNDLHTKHLYSNFYIKMNSINTLGFSFESSICFGERKCNTITPYCPNDDMYTSSYQFVNKTYESLDTCGCFPKCVGDKPIISSYVDYYSNYNLGSTNYKDVIKVNYIRISNKQDTTSLYITPDDGVIRIKSNWRNIDYITQKSNLIKYKK